MAVKELQESQRLEFSWLLLLKMFLLFFKIGAFTIGGGFAMLPLIQDAFTIKNQWLTEEEFVDIIAIVQSMPGTIAINTSVFVGYKVLGVPGVIVSVLGAALPSFIIISIIAYFFSQFRDLAIMESVLKGARPAVVALILMPAFRIGKRVIKTKRHIIFVVVSLSILVFGILHPVVVIVAGGLLGMFFFRNEEIE
ncbi:chromate transporter [Fuchsiella alkaliacetigena]|uniref:chromate transporter n=1 Tax=Fuchsiella alkaliacetigena TaxID=957042 RepID=UPI00200A90B9|nr:chromate transporter [Fuchsiella alkaliacetigena]MCK8825237.1 chromate transporter [Fuchsiella alkaliacetigena]